ncbi:MAG: 30S ribosomal protein S17 [Kofleriaceae bacterium]
MATTTATETTSQDERGSRRTIQGLVTSTKMEKTAVITVIRRVRDRRFHKFVTRRVKYKAHDEHNTAKVGDLVEIIEARPMSRTKRWRILRTIKNAIEQVADEAASTESTSKAAPAAKVAPAKAAGKGAH